MALDGREGCFALRQSKPRFFAGGLGHGLLLHRIHPRQPSDRGLVEEDRRCIVGARAEALFELHDEIDELATQCRCFLVRELFHTVLNASLPRFCCASHCGVSLGHSSIEASMGKDPFVDCWEASRLTRPTQKIATPEWGSPARRRRDAKRETLPSAASAPRALLPRDDHIADELAEVRLFAAQLGGAVR